jgi:hypothetical protein
LADKEKHAWAVVHEILSMTLAKRMLVDHLPRFREGVPVLAISGGMLIRHPDIVYVSLKGDRDSVFLREAYRNSQLIEKSHLVLLKEKMRALVAVPRFPRRGGPRTGEETEGANEGSDMEDDEDDDFSDMDDLIGELGGKSDNDYHWGDGWVGESGATPPDFGDGDDSSSEEAEVTMKEPVNSINGDSSDPVFPDGRQRERW